MKQEGEYFGSQNIQHSENTMRLMLDSNDILREVEIFLKGYYMVPTYDEKTQTSSYEKKSVGEAKANSKGVQSIMFWLKTKINPLTSLSNLSADQYSDFLFRTRQALARNLMSQRINYGITLANYTEIIDVVMETLEPFLTSAISGGHRRSFTSNQETKRIETTVQDRKKILGVF